MKTHLLVLGLLAAGLLGSNANDWPQWRGPNRDDISTEKGLIQKWPVGGPPLAWTATGLGNGYSTVSIADSRIATIGDEGESSFVYVLSEKDGRKIWSAKVGKAGPVGWGNFEGPRSTPTINRDLIFALGQFGELVCLQAKDGKEVWRKNLVSDFGGKLMEWGYSESPLVDGDKVLCTPGGNSGAIAALDRKTGALLWQSKEFTDEAHYSSIVKASFGGVPQYVQLTGTSVASVAANDGRLLWRSPRKGPTATIPTPIIHGDQVFVTSGYGAGCNLYQISKNGDAFQATEVYANKNLKNHHGGVVLLDDYVYGSSDPAFLVCLELKTGNIAWENRSLGKGSVACAEGRLYYRREDGQGTVTLVEATPKGFSEKGSFDQPGRSPKNSWAQPVICNGKLYLRDQDILLCYDIKAK